MLASNRAWQLPGTPTRPSPDGGLGSPQPAEAVMTFRKLKIVAMWIFLGPLIIILGTVDVVTGGRSRKWLLGD